jgi:hypothetical protein
MPAYRRYQHLDDSALQERLTLTILSWLQARGNGNDVAAALYKEEGRQLVSEHYVRGLNPDTGEKF